MGYNSSPPFDHAAHYKKMSVKQIQSIIKKFEKSINEWKASEHFPEPPKFFNEHLQYLRMVLAERIINKEAKNDHHSSRHGRRAR